MIEKIKGSKLGFIQIFIYGYKVLKSNIKEYLLLLFLGGLPLVIINNLITADLLVYSRWIGGLLTTLITLVNLIPVIVIILITDKKIHDKKIDFFTLFNEAVTIWPKVIITFIIINFFVTFGLLFLFIPGIILSVYFIFSNPIVTLTGIFGFEAVKSSFRLVKGQWLKIFGFTLLINGVTLFFRYRPLFNIADLSDHFLINIVLELSIIFLGYYLNTCHTIFFLNLQYAKRKVK